MKKITIIDYDCGNILNLVRALEFMGYTAETTRDSKKIKNSSHVILPGVGAFGNAINKLEEYNLKEVIQEYAKSNKPLLGICLGMQVLLTLGYEFGVHNGLGLIEGEVVKISNKKDKKIKIPHIGWNDVTFSSDHPVFASLYDTENQYYFVHSYYVRPHENSIVAGRTEYGSVFCSAIAVDNVVATQFHPEKSGNPGLEIYENFVKFAHALQ